MHMHDTATASYQRFPTEPVLLQSSLIHKGYPSDRGNLMEHFLTLLTQSISKKNQIWYFLVAVTVREIVEICQHTAGRSQQNKVKGKKNIKI